MPQFRTFGVKLTPVKSAVFTKASTLEVPRGEAYNALCWVTIETTSS